MIKSKRQIIRKILGATLATIIFNSGQATAVYNKTFDSIIHNDKENKLLDFEKDFLIKYLNSNLNLGELFEKKIGKYFQNFLDNDKRKLSFQFSLKDPKKIILTSARIDFSACLLDYLEDKYIALNDSTDKKDVQSRILTLEELKKCQSAMRLELNKIIGLIDDTETKNFVIANTGTNENVANFIFSSRLFLEPDLKRQSKKVKITINSNKKDISKVKYNFLDSSEKNVIFSTEVNKKKLGAQFGGIISIKEKEKEKERKFFKTHQDGSRFTNYSGELYFSRSIGLAKPVNIRELFIYKILEKLGMGPEVKFVVNPFVSQDLYIVTKDLSNDKSNEFFTIAGKIVDNKEIEKLINNKDIILEFTKFDLINRIFGIDDLNAGNYGILSKGDKKFVKIIDFRAPYKNFLLSDDILGAFLKANGDLYRDTDLAKKILSNRQPKQKFTEGLEALKSIDYENFEKILISVKEEIVNFISQRDEISDSEIKEQIGLNSEAIDNLEAYIKTIQYNFKLAMNYFEKNLR
jgi:hypothetical protein